MAASSKASGRPVGSRMNLLSARGAGQAEGEGEDEDGSRLSTGRGAGEVRMQDG